jgi:hypothetical protein
MVTGDQLAIASETARQLGMTINILDASGFEDTKDHDTKSLVQQIGYKMAILKVALPLFLSNYSGCGEYPLLLLTCTLSSYC